MNGDGRQNPSEYPAAGPPPEILRLAWGKILVPAVTRIILALISAFVLRYCATAGMDHFAAQTVDRRPATEVHVHEAERPPPPY